VNTLRIKKTVENDAIKLRLKCFSKFNKRKRFFDENQNIENGANSEGSLSLIDSVSENQEKDSLSESHLQLEEYSNDKKASANFEACNLNSGSTNENNCMGNSTCRNTGPEFHWKEDSPNRERTASLFTKNRRVSVVLNEKPEPDLKELKKTSFIAQSVNSIHSFNYNKKDSRLFMMEFDIMKIFSSYFPHNNINKISKQCWYLVGSLGYERTLSQNKNGFKFWRRKKPTRRKKFPNAPIKSQFRRIKDKKVSFFLKSNE
jgi:hypothetical protein